MTSHNEFKKEVIKDLKVKKEYDGLAPVKVESLRGEIGRYIWGTFYWEDWNEPEYALDKSVCFQQTREILSRIIKRVEEIENPFPTWWGAYDIWNEAIQAVKKLLKEVER